MIEERRRFQRLHIPEDTSALDAEGNHLGRVSLVGGSGMRIEALSPEGEQALQPGRRLRITVVEPAIGSAHTAFVEVRHRTGDIVGVEFVATSAND